VRSVGTPVGLRPLEFACTNVMWFDLERMDQQSNQRQREMMEAIQALKR
jgi:hypothetical protein